MVRKVLPLLLVALAMFSACSRRPSASTSTSTVVFIVRHAEKASKDDDPDISATGIRRAQNLVNVIGDPVVSAIYSSQYKRTQETAEPLSTHFGVPLTKIPVN